MIRYFSIAATVLLCAAVLTTSLAFGGAAAWAVAALEVTAFSALALAVLGARRLSQAKVAATAALLLSGVALLGVLQSRGQPGELLGSLAPYRSLASGQLWAAMAALGLAAALVARRRLHRRLLGACLVAAALAQCIYGARAWMAGSSAIWGLDVGEPTGRFRGTFVNPDHYAVFLEIALAVAFAWCWWALSRASRTASLESRLLLAAPPLTLWLLLFACLAARGVHRRKVLLGITGLGVILGAAVVVLGFGRGFDRLLGTSVADVTYSSRKAVYEACVELWLRSPWTGSGLGTFRDAFPAVQPAEVGGLWTRAHSGPLELLVTGGLLGLVLVTVAVAVSLARLLPQQRRSYRSENRAAALAAIGALTAVLVHEMVDFGLSLPANATALVLVVGAALGAPGPRSRPAAGSQGPRPSP